MYLLNILNNMNNKKCMIPTYYIERWYLVYFRTHTIFPCNLLKFGHYK